MVISMTHTHFFHVLHKNPVQECLTILFPTSSRDFVHNIMCTMLEGYIYYQKNWLDGACPKWNGMKVHACEKWVWNG